jgi:cell division transport system ATP-binding protein
VSIARAFVNHPPLLIADEPTGNLDPDTSMGNMQLLYRINKTGTTVLMATHDREIGGPYAPPVIALDNGKVVRDQKRGGYGRISFFLKEAFGSLRRTTSCHSCLVTCFSPLWFWGACWCSCFTTDALQQESKRR